MKIKMLSNINMKSVLFLLCLVISGGQCALQPEFIRSFLNRPWMLTNKSITDPVLDKQQNQATLSIYVDNWSPHPLKLTEDEIRSGTFGTGLLPKDLPEYSRELSLRSLSSKESQKTSGLVSWTVMNKTIELAILSVAWEVGNGIDSRFTVKLGNRVPEFQEMWAKSKDNKMASTNQLSNTIYVGGMSQLRFEAAANMSMDEGDTLHYKLRLSLVPPNIDVWGWVKYYREPFEAAQQQEKEKQLQEAAKKVADKTPEKNPSKIVPKKKPNPLDEKNPQESRFEQKHLLDNDTELG